MLESHLEAIIKRAVLAALDEREALKNAPLAHNEGRQVYSQAELARRWDVSLTYLRILRKRHLLKTVTLGTRVYATAEEVSRIERDGLPTTGDGRRKAGRKPQPVFAAAAE